LAHAWEGNVRELENCMHRAFLMSLDGVLHAEHLGFSSVSPSVPQQEVSAAVDMEAGMTIRDMERVLIEQTLKHVQGNRTEAAKLLGISIRTLRNKLNDYKSGTPLAVAS